MVAPELPLEMWSTILSNVDNPDDRECESEFQQYRLINKTACAAATPRAFARVTVDETLANAKGLRDLVKRPDLAKHVRVLACRGAERPTYDDLHDSPSEVPNIPSYDAWKPLVEAFSLLPALTSLQTLLIAFDPTTKDTKFQFALLEAMALAYADVAPPIRSLTIDYLAPVSHDLFKMPGFQNILQPLTDLRLGIGCMVTEDSLWGRTLRDSILGAATSLQSLTLYHMPAPDIDIFATLKFPALRHLDTHNTGVDMRNFTGRHDGVKGWIVSLSMVNSYEKGQRVSSMSLRRMGGLRLPYPACLEDY
ncbi:hypothetical protein FA95DRAFT_1562060 [Auriscalpium vulgare]|uniref:Uncharacterized protein n=1 Tax=Auriscalpium vulgare TaxID=40419 RepID=A0ACB8RK26_9AGAM|nr:hypothetical protein FA95DRAFT_1562060 [Auriscalpium vulgare]